MLPERPLTLAQVAEHLQCSERTVRREIAAGRLAAIQIRGLLRVPVWLVVQPQRPDERLGVQGHSTNTRQCDSHHAHQSRASSISCMTTAAARPGRR